MNDGLDPRAILRHLTPVNVLKWLGVLLAAYLAVVFAAWITALAWSSS